MAKKGSEVLLGTLDMLVLKALRLDPMHGWGITERIEQWSEIVLPLGQGLAGWQRMSRAIDPVLSATPDSGGL